MECAKALECLQPYIEQVLDAAETAPLRSHLQACESCRVRFDDEAKVLGRYREILKAPCPEDLRARVRSALATDDAGAHRSSHVGRRGWRRAFQVAAVAALVLVTLRVDPFCFFGCPTVHALALEHRRIRDDQLVGGSDDAVNAFLAKIMGERVSLPDCAKTPGIHCIGAAEIPGEARGCMVRFRDDAGRAISFVKLRGGRMHPWIEYRSHDGVLASSQDGFRFAGWKDGKGNLCGFLCDASVSEEALVALVTRSRAELK